VGLRARRYLPLLVEDETVPGPADLLDDRPMTDIPDDRLRLIVTCCHPALDRSAQVALTFRLICGRSRRRPTPRSLGHASARLPGVGV
jgi:RNA polymerase sigma-70 factor (ECF subfamily)